MEIKLIAAHFMIDKDRRTIGVQHYIMVMVTMAMETATLMGMVILVVL